MLCLCAGLFCCPAESSELQVNGRLRKERHEEARKGSGSRSAYADAVYLTEYRGLTVPQISDLREKLGRDTSYTVAKNTLARIAAKEAGIEGLDEILSGPTAITFVKGDFIEAAKVIRDFAKDNKALVIKGAAADGTVYDAEGAKKLADLKSRPQLLAEFAGDIKASMAKAAYLFNALPTKAVRTIDALREKQEKAA